MARVVAEMSASLLALADAPPLDEEYVGPVIFRGRAATRLFTQLLTRQIEGTPAPLSGSRLGGMPILMGGFESGEGRLGRRVMPVGWGAVDDATRDPDSAASFARDAEGSPTRPVVLIRDGITRDLLMSRVPRAGVEATSGNTRGVGGRPEARVGMLEITPPRRVGERAMLRQAIRLARSYERDFVLVIEDLQDPRVRGLAGQPVFWGGGGGADLPRPVGAWRVYADGRREPVRGLRFAGLERWVLRDLVAAGAQVEDTFLAGGGGGGVTSGLPTWISAPEVLVGELEILPESGDPRDAPGVPAPPQKSVESDP
jgi:hypothetical protein